MNELFLRIFKHLLPTGRAWRLTIDKPMRRFFQGLTGLGGDVRQFLDDIYDDIFPQTTREISTWEDQFALTNGGSLTIQQRRDRLDAAWKALGGQSPRYIQDTLQENGFDVFIHEWWTNVFPFAGVYCGEALAAAGEASAECAAVIPFNTVKNPLDFLAPDNITPPLPGQGFPLVNKIFTAGPDFLVLCGEAIAEAGEADASSGNFLTFKFTPRKYTIPTDPLTWPFFLYIGGETFPDLAQIPVERRDEFEALCLKICPAQQWLGILVEYV